MSCPDRHRTARRAAFEAVLLLLVYSFVTLVVTWPLFAKPATTVLDTDHTWLAGWLTPLFARVAGRDIDLYIWIFAWDWHALTHSPTRLFDANIFHPAPGALAYSDHLLGHLALTGPIQALSGNPVLAHQLNLFLSFPLSGLAMYLLLRQWKAGVAAAFVAGIVYSLSPTRLDMMYHSHLLAGQYFIFALLFLERAASTSKGYDTALFGAFLCLSLLSSYYVAYMTTIGVTISLAVTWLLPPRPLTTGGVARVIMATAGAVAIFVLSSLPYLQMKETGATFDYARWFGGLRPLSNDLWTNYVLPPALLKNSTLHLTQGICAYLGLVPFVLVLLAFARPSRRDPSARNRARTIGVGCIAFGYVLALGPQVSLGGATFAAPYLWGMDLIPGFSAMRSPGRFALFLTVGWAILVGIGCDTIDRWVQSRGKGRLLRSCVYAAILALIAFEYGLGDQDLRAKPAPTVRSELGAYRALASMPSGPLVEVPFGPSAGSELVGRYMVLSTLHWKPLLNGSSGYAPHSQRIVKRVVDAMPDGNAQRLLIRMTDVSYVLYHAAETPNPVEPWLAAEGLRLVGRYGDDWLFELVDRPEPDLVPQLVACSREKSACPELVALARKLPKPASRWPRSRP